jgi:hypothetical protein
MSKATIHLPAEDDPAQPGKKQDRKTQCDQTQVSPSAGRVGGAGARAERPSEGSRKLPDLPQVGRGAKAPSASASGSGSEEQATPPEAKASPPRTRTPRSP